ncbi:unnamed protein product [Rotaria magnacalcarata]|uniref:Uncharacterized protein n=1 Tax=Rotaria magnacalcarata TaxID=392030 RepID=A0A816M2A8_9BILA|nr:unnamed protein product [Rotaria magnacalcarata]CAF1972441.1 unnamed protein product [Rotaria magnacalcarata]CAF4283684.1 unnamed protein product [Rotaria magnacalcarata]
MSSDIPGFYFDTVQQRYYRLSPHSSNNVPSVRAINDRARQEQQIAKQLDLIKPHSKKSSRQHNEYKRLNKSRLSLLRQREYGQTSTELCHNSIRSNFIENLSSTCFLDNTSSFSLPIHFQGNSNYEMTITSTGQSIQLLDYKLYLNLLDNPTYTYQLQPNTIDGYRSSYFIDSSSPFMSVTLLNDENHAIIRFLKFSAIPSDHSLLMLSSNPLAAKYYYEEKYKTLHLPSPLMNHTSPLMIKCSGPCCYSESLDRFAFNINNFVYIYDLQTFNTIVSLRVPIRRVTLNDMKFSYENSNIIYTTNGQQFQQWDMRQSNRSCSLRMPILCSTIKCLKSKSNCILTSSFDEQINLLDLRMATKPLLIYNCSSSSSNNPHFTFEIDSDTENFIVACSQYHILYTWDLKTSQLLNRLRCPIPQRFIHTSIKCSIACADKMPILGVYHPEYCRITGMMNRKFFS